MCLCNVSSRVSDRHNATCNLRVAQLLSKDQIVVHSMLDAHLRHLKLAKFWLSATVWFCGSQITRPARDATRLDLIRHLRRFYNSDWNVCFGLFKFVLIAANETIKCKWQTSSSRSSDDDYLFKVATECLIIKCIKAPSTIYDLPPTRQLQCLRQCQSNLPRPNYCIIASINDAQDYQSTSLSSNTQINTRTIQVFRQCTKSWSRNEKDPWRCVYTDDRY